MYSYLSMEYYVYIYDLADRSRNVMVFGDKLPAFLFEVPLSVIRIRHRSCWAESSVRFLTVPVERVRRDYSLAGHLL